MHLDVFLDNQDFVKSPWLFISKFIAFDKQ